MKNKLDKEQVFKNLTTKRDENIKDASSWQKWEIEEELQRVKDAKKVFLQKNPIHDLTIIEERINQLEESLKLCE